MIETKLFELRDEMTMIPVIASATRSADDESERWLLRRAGYSHDSTLVLLSRLDGGRAAYDPHAWGDRTYAAAHTYLQEHWHELKSGEVIDVRFILGETASPCSSDRITDQ